MDWLQALHSTDKRTKHAASYNYSNWISAPDEATTVLLQALKDPDPFVREHAAAALGELHVSDFDAIRLLVRTLRDNDSAVQSQSTLALAKIGQPAAQQLLAALTANGVWNSPRTESILWEDYAAASLVLMQEAAAQPLAETVLQVVDQEPPPQINVPHPEMIPPSEWVFSRLEFFERVAGRLGPIGARIYADRLFQGAASVPDYGGRVRMLAMDALRFGHQSGLIDPDASRTARLAQAIVATGDPKIDSYALVYLGDIGYDVIQILLASGRRKDALEILSGFDANGQMMERWAVFLEKALASPEMDLHLSAVYWLGRHKQRAIPISHSALMGLINSQAPYEQIVGVGYSFSLGDRSQFLIETLIKLLSSPALQKDLSKDTIEQLAAFGRGAISAESLLDRYASGQDKGSEWLVQYAAVRALGEIGADSPATKVVLTALLNNGSYTTLSVAAADSLLKIGVTEAEAVSILQRQNVKVDTEAMSHLFGLHHENTARRPSLSPVRSDVSALISQAGSGPSNSRCAALQELSKIGSGSVQVWPLIRSSLSSADSFLASCAASVIGKFGKPEAEVEDALKTYLMNEQVLPMRRLPSPLLSPSMNRPYRIAHNESINRFITNMEAANLAHARQDSLIFGVFLDYRIFESVQHEVAYMAEKRLDLANPPPERAVGAGPPQTAWSSLPRWPWNWPPPQFTSWGVVPLTSLPAHATIGLVYSRLQSSLGLNGYQDNRLFAIPEGVAIVCHMEKINPDGTPVPGDDRWSDDAPSVAHMSMLQYAADAFMGIRADYRLFIFFITKQADISGGTSTLSYDSARHLTTGARVLPPDIGELPWAGYYLHAVSYLFHKKNGTVTPVQTDLPSSTQLKRAGILFALESRP